MMVAARSPSAARIAGLGVHLPPHVRHTHETERALRRASGLPLPTGLIARMTGVESVHVATDLDASDLAVEAARAALAESPGDVDLLIFASASQDLIEPATSHIVSAKLGLDGVPVLDVKNACNSVLNGLQVAEALIRAGQYERVLVASGEKPSSAVRWAIRDRAEFMRSFPGFTMSDGGAAIVLERTDDPARGILAQSFHAESQHWNIGTLPAGGTMRPRDLEATYFDMDGHALRAAFMALGPDPVHRFLRKHGWTWDDFDFVAIHQVSAPFLPPVFEGLGVPMDRSIVTVTDHGNLASATLPLQIQLARQRGLVAAGSLLLLIGLAGGISLGLTAVRL
ncbi:3-oxoacyl-[acyl-carrier-protein] synthase-3 [Microbacterium resistens]|uniref:3-oxoacyl-[acyl-carrier-protein] synthase-3 n=1 Tax=Microbacterium resistens TaxID=156977 RepID=A0ABU1SCE0_9MICO|nr:3-oxoacyl-[acyl-carrier-protein] synthase III C-terminal domain-containing protein [Microbacterium resistens]MDR6866588.1 3-oxoacyl-[acyl-carrier-protein] synthase-3 [Microbacterium resistens]